jgi:anti-anti-sigma regulatory factor
MLQHTTQVHAYLMGHIQVENTTKYVKLDEFPEAKTIDGMILIGLSGPVQFYNVQQLWITLESLLERELSTYSSTSFEHIGHKRSRTCSEALGETWITRKLEDKQALSQTLKAMKHVSDSSASTGLLSSKRKENQRRFFVILDFSKCIEMDSCSVYSIGKLVEGLEKKAGVTVLLSDVKASIKSLLVRSGMRNREFFKKTEIAVGLALRSQQQGEVNSGRSLI